MRAVASLLVVAFACGPEAGFVDPELRSVVCGNTEPLRISTVPGGFGGLRWLGELYSVVSGEPASEDRFSFSSYAVDPCGERPPERYAEGWARPAGRGWVVGHLESLWWSPALGEPATALPVGSGSPFQSTEAGLFVLDGANGRLSWFRSPDAAAVVVADDVDAEAVGQSYDRISRSSPPFAVAGDLAWYVSQAATLEQIDLRTEARSTVAISVSAVFHAPWNEIVAWTTPVPDGPPYATTTILRTDTGERVQLPGHVQNLALLGFVTTSTLDLAAVHELATGRTHILSTPGALQVVHADARAAWIVVERSSATRWADVVRLDMHDGRATVVAERVGRSVEARPDALAGGILLFAGDPEDPRGYGRIFRISDAGVDTVAENVSSLYRVAADGRVLYVDHAGALYEGGATLRMRNPDGRDRRLHDDAVLLDALQIERDPATDPTPVDLQGDVLYNVLDGPERGLWRMPFEDVLLGERG